MRLACDVVWWGVGFVERLGGEHITAPAVALAATGGPPRQQRRGPLGPVVGASAHNQQTSVSEPDICTSRYIRDMEKVQTAPVAAAVGGRGCCRRR